MSAGLVVVPLVAPEFTLDELLSKVTKGNLHQEVDSRDAAGKEVW